MVRPTTKESIGIGFIGTGDIAKIHKTSLARCEGVRLTAVYDINMDATAAFAEGTGACVCRSPTELVQHKDVDAVFVLTPLKSHFENAMLALEAGKHTFVEKPVSVSKDEIRQMIDLAQAKSVQCVPGHNYIHSDAMKRAREMIGTGKLGQIYLLWIIFSLCIPLEWSFRLPGVLREVMIHHFYSLLFLIGRPESISAVAGDPRGVGANKSDQVSITCKFKNGTLANLLASFCADDFTAYPWTVIYKVLGSDGSFSHSWSDSRYRDRPQPIWDLPAYWETFANEDRYFVEECLRKGKPPLSTIEDALTCLEILHSAEASIETGRLMSISYEEVV